MGNQVRGQWLRPRSVEEGLSLAGVRGAGSRDGWLGSRPLWLPGLLRPELLAGLLQHHHRECPLRHHGGHLLQGHQDLHRGECLLPTAGRVGSWTPWVQSVTGRFRWAQRTELKLEDKHRLVIQRDVGHHVAYTTREVGQYLVVETSTGIIVIWDKKTTIFIKLAPSYKVRGRREREREGTSPSPSSRCWKPLRAPVSAGLRVRPVWELRPALQQRLHHARPHGGGERAGLREQLEGGPHLPGRNHHPRALHQEPAPPRLGREAVQHHQELGLRCLPQQGGRGVDVVGGARVGGEWMWWGGVRMWWGGVQAGMG